MRIACTPRFANGDVVPMPRNPAEVNVEVPVAPNAAEPDDNVPDAKRLVPVALVNVSVPLNIFDPVNVLLV